MKMPPLRMLTHCILAGAVALAIAGCKSAPGKPGVEVARPEEVVDFATLYGQNCAGCHGEKGKAGAAIALANPEYLAIASAANIQRVTANGVPATTMPPFGKTAGGMLTDKQIALLANGMISTWGNTSAVAGQTPPGYAISAAGNSVQGEKVFATFCAQCHGADATGATANGVTTGSLVETSYLALISDQGLRSFTLAGPTEQDAHNWRSYIKTRPMTDAEITDVVAWLASHRIATPGQVHKQHP